MRIVNLVKFHVSMNPKQSSIEYVHRVVITYTGNLEI